MTSGSPLLETYLKQQRELYGDRIYLTDCDPDMTTETVHEDLNLSDELKEYEAQICDCMRCELGNTRTNFVFGSGSPQADIVFVGEAPGQKEDLNGLPFVGRAGQLLDKILEAIGLDRNDVFICNVLKCRPPENRDPLAGEIEKCEPYLKHQLQLIKPRVIVALGRIAAKTLLRIDEPLGKMREQTYSYEGIDTLVTYHPAALLRNPNLKRPAWEDFKKIRDTYLNPD